MSISRAGRYVSIFKGRYPDITFETISVDEWIKKMSNIYYFHCPN